MVSVPLTKVYSYNSFNGSDAAIGGTSEGIMLIIGRITQ